MNKGTYILQPPNSLNEQKELSYLAENIPDICQIEIVVDGQQMKMPSIVNKALIEVIRELNNGNSVTLIPTDKELTTQQAADILNVSRPYFIKLLENGDINFKKTGTHRKILMQDLMKYREQRNETRKTKIQELTQLSQDLGLYD